MIKLIVGLGNHPERYLKTRHNAGFWLLDELISAHGGNWKDDKKFCAQSARITLAQRQILLIKPQTFMNNSGKSVAAVCNFFNITAAQMLIVHDELDLPDGIAKLKYGGGHGGHNGLRDIINACASRDFYRLRLGISRPENSAQVIDYVLQQPNNAQRQNIAAAIASALRILPILITDGSEKAMNLLHDKS